MGLWNAPDFRIRPAGEFHTGELAVLGLAVLVFGLVWSIRRHELALPAAVLACGIIYWRAHGQSPYVTAKALTIACPVIAVTDIRGLLRAPVPRLALWTGGARALAAAGFVIVAGYCSYLALRDEPVWASDSTNELLSLAGVTRNQPLLFLGATDDADWIFSGSEMSTLAANSVSMGQAAPRATTPDVTGDAFDFDSVDPADLNRFTWFITSTTTYASQPPAGVTLIRRLPMYELWRRTGEIVPRQNLDPAGAPGAVLGCSTAAGRRIRRQPGTAAVMAAPVVTPLIGLEPGTSDIVTLHLPAGTWSLSMQYVSPINVDVTSGARHWRMPAYDDRLGPFFSVGSVVSTGAPLAVSVTADRPSALTGPSLAAQLAQLAAVPSPDPRTMVPLHRACGRYVDWYRLQT